MYQPPYFIKKIHFDQPFPRKRPPFFSQKTAKNAYFWKIDYWGLRKLLSRAPTHSPLADDRSKDQMQVFTEYTTYCFLLRPSAPDWATKIVLSGNWSVWDTLRYWLAESFFRNGGIWQNKRFMTNIPSVGVPAFPLSMDFFLYHPPVSLLGRRATGRMCLSTQVLSSSRIRSTSKPTQARWKVLMEGKTSTKPILVCAAVA